MEGDTVAVGLEASTSEGKPVKPPKAESKDVYGKVEIDINVQIVPKESIKPKEKEMNKIFDMLSDEVKIPRPVGPLFRSIYLKLSKFNGEFVSLQKIPGALVFTVKFTSLKDIENFKKEKTKRDLKKELISAFEGHLSSKNPFEKLDLNITIDPNKQITKDVRTMRKESHDHVSEGENLAKEVWKKGQEMQTVDAHLEGFINKRCTLVAETECIYQLGLHRFRLKEKVSDTKRSRDENEKNEQPKKKKKQELKTDVNSAAPKEKSKQEPKSDDRPSLSGFHVGQGSDGTKNVTYL